MAKLCYAGATSLMTKLIVLYIMLEGSQSFYNTRLSTKVPMPVKVSSDCTTIVITWTPPEGAATCEVKLSGDGEMCTEQTKDTDMKFDNLVPGTNYVVTVCPLMPNGRGTPIVRKVSTKMEERIENMLVTGGEIPEDSQCSFPADVVQNAYMNKCGEECAIENIKYKFVSFDCGTINNKMNFNLRLHGMEGPWKEHCGVLCCTTLHVKVYGTEESTGWMDANKHVIPFSDTMYNDGYRCLRTLTTNMSIRSISFGGGSFSGRVVCRIGIPRDGKRISGISIVN